MNDTMTTDTTDNHVGDTDYDKSKFNADNNDYKSSWVIRIMTIVITPITLIMLLYDYNTEFNDDHKSDTDNDNSDFNIEVG